MERALQTDSRTGDADVMIRPFAQAHVLWRGLTHNNPQASLYHSDKWIELLRRVYGLRITLAQFDSRRGSAACVLAHSRNPFARRVVALPFSDFCPPLGDSDAVASLLAGLASKERQLGEIELRGVAQPQPWSQLDHFALWKLDLRESPRVLQRSFSANFRRNVRKAAHRGVDLANGTSDNFIKRFHRLNVESRRRLGLPAQSLRFFRTIADLFPGEFEIWLASSGNRDRAAVFLLGDRSRLYYKWGARCAEQSDGAMHLLFWRIVEESAQRFEHFDLGRADRRNHGLSRFKHELGAVPISLPYSFFPRAPRLISSEHLSGAGLLAARAWKRLPLPIARVMGAAVYGFLS